MRTPDQIRKLRESLAPDQRELANVITKRNIDLWKSLFGNGEEIFKEDLFFHAGGDSLAAVQFIETVEKELGVQLPIPLLMSDCLEEISIYCVQNGAKVSEKGGGVLAKLKGLIGA